MKIVDIIKKALIARFYINIEDISTTPISLSYYAIYKSTIILIIKCRNYNDTNIHKVASSSIYHDEVAR